MIPALAFMIGLSRLGRSETTVPLVIRGSAVTSIGVWEALSSGNVAMGATVTAATIVAFNIGVLARALVDA